MPDVPIVAHGVPAESITRRRRTAPHRGLPRQCPPCHGSEGSPHGRLPHPATSGRWSRRWLGVVLLVFILFHYFGGDPSVILGRAERRRREQIAGDPHTQLGLDQPLVRAALDLPQADRHLRLGPQLGHQRERSRNLFATRLPATLTVMMPILVLDTLLALPIAMWVAYRARLADRPRDHGRSRTVALSISLPGLRHRRPVRVRASSSAGSRCRAGATRLCDEPGHLRAAAGAAGGVRRRSRRRRACTAPSSSTSSATTTCAPRAPRA